MARQYSSPEYLRYIDFRRRTSEAKSRRNRTWRDKRARRPLGRASRQIKTHAFSFHNWAIPDPRPNVNRNVYLRCWRHSGIMSLTAINRCKEQQKAAYPTDLDLSGQGDSDDIQTDNTATYLLVGCTTRQQIELAHINHLHPGYPMNEIIGTRKPRSNIEEFNTGEGRVDQTLLYVVATIQPESSFYYVLLEPEGGFCHPYRIPNKAIFFFWQFRSMKVATTSQCSKSWRKAVDDKIALVNDGYETDSSDDTDIDLDEDLGDLEEGEINANGEIEVVEVPPGVELPGVVNNRMVDAGDTAADTTDTGDIDPDGEEEDGNNEDASATATVSRSPDNENVESDVNGPDQDIVLIDDNPVQDLRWINASGLDWVKLTNETALF